MLAPLGIDSAGFWAGFAVLADRLVPVNRALLVRRDALQAQIDGWYLGRTGQPIDAEAYYAFLTQIGYLVPEPAPFAIATNGVDAEIATMAGPQLVVPMLNDRFLLNAANARWGSLYDASYGTDALDVDPARPGGYDPVLGGAVIAAVRAFLDQALPLAMGSWADWDGADVPALADPAQYAGRKPARCCFATTGCMSRW